MLAKRTVRWGRIFAAAAPLLLVFGCGNKNPADVVGMPNVGKIDFDFEHSAPQTPYGGGGAAGGGCDALGVELRRLTDALGGDADIKLEEDVKESFGDKAGKALEKAPDHAGDEVYGRIVALNPARGVLRFLSGAKKKERDYAYRIFMLEKRRAYLRGQFDSASCAAGDSPPWAEQAGS